MHTYSKKIIDEVSKWRLWTFRDKKDNLVWIWAKEISDAHEQLPYPFTTKWVLDNCLSFRYDNRTEDGITIGSPWDLAARVLHHRQSHAGKTKSDRKAKSSSENLNKARSRKRVLGNNVSELDSE